MSLIILKRFSHCVGSSRGGKLASQARLARAPKSKHFDDVQHEIDELTLNHFDFSETSR